MVHEEQEPQVREVEAEEVQEEAEEQQEQEAQNPMQAFKAMMGSEVRAALAEQEQARYHQAQKAQEEQRKALEKQAEEQKKLEEEQAKKQKEQQKLEEEQALKAQEEQRKAWEEHQKAQQKNLEYTVRTRSKEASKEALNEQRKEDIENHQKQLEEEEKRKRKEYEEDIKRHQPRMKFLNPKKRFDKKEFVEGMDKYGDLEKWMKKLKEDPTNPDNLRDLGKLVANDESYFFGKPTDKVFEAADRLASLQTAYIAGYVNKDNKIETGYVENNWSKFMELLQGDALKAVFGQLLFFKTGDSVLDSLIDLINETRNTAQIRKEGRGLLEYVEKKMSKKPKWAKERFEDEANDNHALMQYFEAFAAQTGNRLELETTKPGKGNKRKFDEGKIKRLICRSLDTALDAFDDEEHPGAKQDIFDDAVKQTYIHIAHEVFPGQKAEYKMDKDPDREIRKKYRKSVLGMVS